MDTIVKEIVILVIDVLGTLSHLTVTTEVIPVTVSVLNKFILDGLIITKEVNILSTTLEDLSACDGTCVTKWCWQELAVGRSIKILVGLVITKDKVDASSKDVSSVEVLSRPFGNLFIRRQLLTI